MKQLSLWYIIVAKKPGIIRFFAPANKVSYTWICSSREPTKDGVIATFDEHEDSVYAVEWSTADPWVFASLSYDGRLVINRVPRAEKYKILLWWRVLWTISMAVAQGEIHHFHCYFGGGSLTVQLVSPIKHFQVSLSLFFKCEIFAMVCSSFHVSENWYSQQRLRTQTGFESK